MSPVKKRQESTKNSILKNTPKGVVDYIFEIVNLVFGHRNNLD